VDISSLSVQDITTYLKNVMETESSLFKQKMARQEAQNCLHFNEPLQKEILKPKKQLPTEPKPSERLKELEKWNNEFTFTLIFVGFIALCAFLYVLNRYCMGVDSVAEMVRDPISVLAPLLYLLLMLWLRFSNRKKYEEELQNHKSKLNQYRAECDASEKAFRQELENYNKELLIAEEAHRKEVAAARNFYNLACEQVQLMDKPIIETEEILSQLYALDIVFPKYRTLPAVCMFYEYFASGRCSELSGPNGAYNLYETELRQNLIIKKLDAILGSLEGIKQNQFILYTEVKKTANALPMISRDIAALLDSTKEVSHSTTIAAQCAEATKANTDMLKYLAFIKH